MDEGITIQEAIKRFDDIYAPMMQHLNEYAQTQGFEAVDFLITCGLLANVGKNRSESFGVTLDAFITIADVKMITKKDIANVCEDIVSRC